MAYYHTKQVAFATPKQIAFMRSLMAERGMSEDTLTLSLTGHTMREASEFIGWLLKQPKVASAPKATGTGTGLDLSEVPAGRYAAPGEDDVLRFVRIDKPEDGKWQGYVFAKVQASDEFHRLGMQRPGQGYTGKLQDVLRRIVDDPKGAMTRYGQEIGHCGRCGRTLTDADSRERGIGPDCAKILGWLV